MPRRYYDYKEDCPSSYDEPPRKKSFNGVASSTHFQQGEEITDITGKNWKLGKTIGIGGFGEIYEACEDVPRGEKTDNFYVAKVEKHTSGPLFVEVNCYLRIGKYEMIEDWKKANNMEFLGMPHYVASGSCYYNDEKYRFLLLPKFKRDLGQILREKRVFNIKTVCNICIQILDVLEYIHTKGYIHSDIKASNIMIGNQTKLKSMTSKNAPKRTTTRSLKIVRVRKHRRNLRPVGAVNYSEDIPYLEDVLDDTDDTDVITLNENEAPNQVYLLDFGLATKYLLSNGEHKEFSADERRAHAGTVLFCSRDAHQGIPSRQSDLESLAYNMVYWLTGSLPWIDDIEQPIEVEKKKIRCLRNLKEFLNLCFNNDFPQFIVDYFEYLNKLQFKEDPDYEYCRSLLKKAIKLYGYKNNSDLDFDNSEGWGKKKQKIKAPKSKKKIISYHSFLKSSPLMPLHSNIVFKRPKLRKKLKDIEIQDSMMNWSKILIMDPETIIKQARERKITEDSEPEISRIDIHSMNPTYAMLEVYNKCKNSFSDSVECIEGFTQAMMSVYLKMQERKKIEENIQNTQRNGVTRRKTRSTVKRSESPIERTSRSRPQNGQKKDSVPCIPTKKSKNCSFKRNYREIKEGKKAKAN